MALGYYNGNWVEPGDATVALEDRGHQYGDGVYETMRAYEGKVFRLEQHLERLMQSLSAISIAPPCGVPDLVSLVEEAMDRSELAEAVVYLQVTRGTAPRQHLFPAVPPNLSLTVRPAPPLDTPARREGAAVLLLPDERWANCHIKTISLLPNVLAKQKATEAGCNEAVFVRDGLITEGSSANIFAVHQGALFTSPESRYILAGVTRAVVLELATAQGFEVHEEAFTEAFLLAADELFLTSTTIEVLPVVRAGQQPIGDGRPGKITRALESALRQLVASNGRTGTG